MDMNFDEFEPLFKDLEKQKSELADQRLRASKILEHAKTQGLDPQNIFDIVKACTGHDCNPLIAGILIKSLIPRTNVPEDAVICALARVCSGKLSLRIQKLLLEWVVHNFDAIYPKLNVYSLYGMIFNILDNDFLCVSVCHLLSLMIKTEDMSYFRIRQLAQYQRRAGNSQHVRSLLKILQMQTQRAITGRCSYTTPVQRNENGSSASLLALIPANCCILFKDSDIRCSVAQRQHMIAIMPEQEIAPHLEFWLQHHLSKHLENSLEQMDTPGILKSLFMMKNILQKTFSIWGAFLYDFLETWNGSDHCEMVLNFIENIPLSHFINLRDRLFGVIKKIFIISTDILLKCKVVDTLSGLTCNYIYECAEAVEKSHSILFIKDLIRFVEDMVLECLLLSDDNSTIFHAVLEYWEIVSCTLLLNKIDVSLVPHFYLVYKAVFGVSSVYLSSICEIFHRLLCISSSHGSAKSQQKLTNQVSEIYKVLCRHDAGNFLSDRGFIIQSLYSGQYIGENFKGDCTKLSSRPCFCLQKHPALMTHVAAYTVQEGNNPDFMSKVGTVHFLKSEGVTGVDDLFREMTN